jgi:hypothetical protein
MLPSQPLRFLLAGDVFVERDRLIARVDQLARREDLVERLKNTDWDLVVVDEAHRLSAHKGSAGGGPSGRHREVQHVLTPGSELQGLHGLCCSLTRWTQVAL